LDENAKYDMLMKMLENDIENAKIIVFHILS